MGFCIDLIPTDIRAEVLTYAIEDTGFEESDLRLLVPFKPFAVDMVHNSVIEAALTRNCFGCIFLEICGRGFNINPQGEISMTAVIDLSLQTVQSIQQPLISMCNIFILQRKDDPEKPIIGFFEGPNKEVRIVETFKPNDK